MFETRITEDYLHKSRKFIRRVGDSLNYITSHTYQLSYEKPYVTDWSSSIDLPVRKLRIP